jgi:hypothetical protein
MHVYAATLIPVQDSAPGISVRVHSSPRQFFKVTQDRVNLCFTRIVLRCPGSHRTTVPVNKMKGVRHCGHGMRIAAKHPDFGSIKAFVVLLLHQIFRGFFPTARAVPQKFDKHSAKRLSMETSALIT